jgi:hypothetical protein
MRGLNLVLCHASLLKIGNRHRSNRNRVAQSPDTWRPRPRTDSFQADFPSELATFLDEYDTSPPSAPKASPERHAIPGFWALEEDGVGDNHTQSNVIAVFHTKYRSK